MKFQLHKRTILVAGLLAAAAILITLVASRRSHSLPEGLLQANGRLEGDHITVASKFPGRVHEIFVEEGDEVAQGQVLVRLDDSQVRTKVNQASEGVAAMEAQLQSAETALKVFRKQVPLAVESAEATVAHALATNQKAEAAEQQAERDAQRFRELALRGTVDSRRSEQADLAWTAAREDTAATRSGHTVALKHLGQAELGYDQVGVKEAQVKALRAQLGQARAALAEAESVEADLTIKAPAGGVVTTRLVDPGETVAAGAPLVDVVDLDRLYLKVYVPEVEIGRLRRGLAARVYTDAFPDEFFPATVRTIASRAEFTPKEVQTPDERVKLVYAVKLYLENNSDHRLTPGQPADAVIRWREEAAWARPVW